jgi:hypothetical protein
MKHHLETQIDIAASPETVYGILTDLESYSEWNPLITSSEGTVAVGERLTNRLEPPGSRAMTFKPTVTVVEPGRKFEWLGRLLLPGVFDGRHGFELEATPTGTRVTHGEHFSGILVRFMRKMIDGSTRQGFEAMNVALKSRAEVHAEAP